MRVAIYTRVSTDEQARHGTSLEVQREFLEGYVKREGLKLYRPEKDKVYEDDGYSGENRNRPALKRLVVDARLRKFDLVLVYKTDRFARNNRLLLNLVEELDGLKVGFKSATESFDTVSAAGKMALSMLGTVAQFERDRIIERVFPGMVKGVERGNWQGSRYSPYGYSYDKEKKLLEVVPNEVKVVKSIYTMYLSGQSTSQIAGYLYDKNYKTRSGGKFHSKLVRDILKNQMYLGKIVWNKYSYDKKQKTLKGYKAVKNDASKVITSEGRHKAIISQKDFDDVQKKLEKNRKGMGSRKGCKEYPLTGIVKCAKCGHNYYGALHVAAREKGETKKKRRYYRCSGRATHYVKCDNVFIKADDLEREIYKILEITFSGDIDASRLKLIMMSHSHEGDEDITDKINELKMDLAVNLKKQERLGKIFSEGLLAMEAYKPQILPLRDEEKEIKSKINKLELSLVEQERSEEYKKLLLSVVSHIDTIKRLDIAGKKGLLKLVFKTLIVEGGRLKKFELYQPFKGLYEGAKIKCQNQENQALTTIPASVCTYVLTADRWMHWGITFTRYLSEIYRN